MTVLHEERHRRALFEGREDGVPLHRLTIPTTSTYSFVGEAGLDYATLDVSLVPEPRAAALLGLGLAALALRWRPHPGRGIHLFGTRR